VEYLAQALANVPDFSATFNQITSSSKGSRLQTAHGQLWISKPSRFRWHAEPPMEQVLVADGEMLWLYDPDLEQVTIQKMEPAMATLPVLILTGNVTRLSQDFIIDHYEDETGDHFSFRPKADAESFKLVLMLVKEGQIKRIDITDTLNQETSIVLTNIQTEESFPKDMFQFQVPDGTDVIRDF
jgi:outer membrane lipoprotein carrier protein